MASDDFAVALQTLDASGGSASSELYRLTASSLSQGSPVGDSAFSEGFSVVGGLLSPPDVDGEGVRDFLDNCLFDPNERQRDTNRDGFGNLCDADLNNDGSINSADIPLFRRAFSSTPESPRWNPDADFNGDDIVDIQDFLILRMALNTTPGPSGRAP